MKSEKGQRSEEPVSGHERKTNRETLQMTMHRKHNRSLCKQMRRLQLEERDEERLIRGCRLTIETN